MITSRFPIWRTNPGGFDKAGFWPGATGALAVLLFVPILALLAQVLVAALVGGGNLTPGPMGNMFALLIASPILTWAVLLVAVPLSAVLARKGYAGWGVAACAGLLAGFLCLLFVEGRLLADEVFLFFGIGLFVALVFWGSIRMIHPLAIGVPSQKAG